MDSDFSFVLVSSLQPAASSKKKNKTGSALSEKKLALKIPQHERVPDKVIGDLSNYRRRTRSSTEKLIKEWNKENDSNTSNLQNSGTMKGKSKSLISVDENSSVELPNMIDLKNVCVRKRKVQKRYFGNKDSSNEINNINNKSCSPEEIEKDPYALSFSDDSIDNSCNRKSSKNSKRSLSIRTSKNVSIKSNSSSEISDNFLKRRSSNSNSPFVNSFDSDPIQRPRLRGRKIIPQTPESDKSDFKNSKLNTSSSFSSNRVSDDSRLSGVNSLSNCDFKKLSIVDDENPRKKLRSSDFKEIKSTDVSLIEASIDSIKPTRRKLHKGFSNNVEIKNKPKDARHSSQTVKKKISNSENDSLNSTLSGGEKKFFKENKKSTATVSYSSFFRTRKSSLLNLPSPSPIVDLISSDDSLIEPSIITPTTVRKRKSPVLRESIKTPPSNKKQITGRLNSLHKSSTGSTNENKFFKGNNSKIKINTKKTSPGNSRKSRRSSSLPRLITPPLSTDKLRNINNWLRDTSKHKSDHKDDVEIIRSSIYFNDQGDKSKSLNSPMDKKKDYDVMSCSSSSVVSESVGISENILNQLYGTVWQKQRNEVLPKSEPRRGRRKTDKEEKKQRMSIFDVFSSSSSEDRFEQFLENVGKHKVKKKQSVKKLNTPDFINDSSSENDTSMTFYHSHIAKDVKSDVGSLLKNKLDLTSLPKKTVKQRKLSFTSSADGEVKSIKATKKSKEKDLPKKKDGVKSRTKGSKKTASNEFENDVNFVLQDDDILKSKLDEFSINDDIENILNPKKKEPIRKSNENISKPKTKAGRKSTEKALTKKVMGKEKLPDDLKMTPKLDTDSSVKKKLREVNVNKIQFNPSFVVADLMSPFSTKKKSSENIDKKSVAENFKLPNAVDIMNTPLPNPKKNRGVAASPGLTLSFLSSLSEITGNLKCHPEALFYKKNFKKKKEELARKLFNLYNKEIFEFKLPSDMSIQWNSRMRSTSGFCYNKRTYVAKREILRSSRIVLSTKILDRPARLRDTLVHELCHAATWIVNGMSDGHGPNWRAWADKATRRFPELPRITRCHDYSIQTKYTYKCMGCGYCIGRHSKSLDVNRKRCGYCYGKFEVFLTSKVATDSAPSESDSVKVPRTPSAFAMFVKENYGTVKKENTKLPHGDVMKLLGQKFAAVKLSKI